MSGKCNEFCDGEHDCCCLDCPDREDCNTQCEMLDAYEFIEDCPDYIKESEVEHERD